MFNKYDILLESQLGRNAIKRAIDHARWKNFERDLPYMSLSAAKKHINRIIKARSNVAKVLSNSDARYMLRKSGPSNYSHAKDLITRGKILSRNRLNRAKDRLMRYKYDLEDLTKTGSLAQRGRVQREVDRIGKKIERLRWPHEYIKDPSAFN